MFAVRALARSWTRSARLRLLQSFLDWRRRSDDLGDAQLARRAAARRCAVAAVAGRRRLRAVGFGTWVQATAASRRASTARKSVVKRLAATLARALLTRAFSVLSRYERVASDRDRRLRSNAELTAARDDYLHAITAYFDCSFSACHKPIVLSTSPHAITTHWKQVQASRTCSAAADRDLIVS